MQKHPSVLSENEKQFNILSNDFIQILNILFAEIFISEHINQRKIATGMASGN